MSPVPSETHTDSPQSTESEQSQALDPDDPSLDLRSTLFDLPVGIMHRPEGAFDPLPTYLLDEHGMNDPTMTSTFGIDFADFGTTTGLDDNAVGQLGLSNLFDKMRTVPATASTSAEINFLSAYAAALGWTSAPAAEPHLISPKSLKRKDSDSSTEFAPVAKRPRGRPSKPRPEVKRPYSRRSKLGTSVPALVAAVVSETPASRNVIIPDLDESDVDSDGPMRKTKSGKLSTARPKSVVPEKYLKDGSAQTILGMSADQIQSFPTFEELLKMVSPNLRSGATEFGERIKENRDKAKDAAKKSRHERRAKIDSLEETVADLEGKIEGMKGVMQALVSKGLLSQAEMAEWI